MRKPNCFIAKPLSAPARICGPVTTLILSIVLDASIGFSSQAKADSLSGPHSNASDYIAKAHEQQLSEHKGWLNLLFYKERLSHLFGRSSLIDDPTFFLAKDGDTDPKAELTATLKAFLADTAEAKAAFAEKPNRHPLCRFPARQQFVQEQLGIPAGDFAQVDCPDRDQFLSQLSYDKVSLVFAHYFINSPQSMFGHTFLRLGVTPKTTAKGGGQTSPLLDDVVNFSAQVPPDQVNGPFYAISGLLGGYRGRFQLMPFYQKVQEYNNLESRDLWEYPLDLSQKQIRTLQKLLWELGDTYINYYFLTENCSYALLGLLEAVLPDSRLTSNFPLVAIPADTLRAVVERPTFVGVSKAKELQAQTGDARPIDYRPSGLARFLWQAETLQGEQERVGVAELVTGPDAKLADAKVYQRCSVACKQRLLDTAIEYIDFNQRVGNAEQGGDFGPLRGRLLASRARLPTAQVRPRRQPISDPPHLGHRSSVVNLGAVTTSAGTAAIERGGFVHIRPALQDISANPRGYSDQMEIRFFDLWLNLVPKGQNGVRSADAGNAEGVNIDVSRFSLVKIFSLPDSTVLLSPKAWSFDLGFEPFATAKDARNLRHRYHLAISVGQSFRAHGERPLIRPFILAGAKAYTEYKADHQGLAPFATAGATVAGKLPLRLTVIGTIGTNIDRITELHRQGEAWTQLEGILALDLHQNMEARLHSEAYGHVSRWRLGLGYYF